MNPEENRVLSSTHISALLMDAGADEFTAGHLGIMIYRRIYGPMANPSEAPTITYSEALRRLEEGLVSVQVKNREIIEQCGKAIDALKFRSIMSPKAQP